MSRILPRPGTMLGAAVPLLILAAALPLIAASWQVARLEREVEAAGGRVETATRCPDWLWTAAAWINAEGRLSFLDTRVTVIDLGGTTVDDAWLERIRSFTEVEQLDLAHTRITDRGLAALSGMHKLTVLDLSGTRMYGSGLAEMDFEGFGKFSERFDCSDERLWCFDVTDRDHVDRILFGCCLGVLP